MSDRWDDIAALFDEALDRPPGERGDWLNEACEEETLRRTVERLLAAHERSSGILDQPPPGADDLFASTPSLTNERLGPYRLLRKIGRGGMGTVYLAERDDDQFAHRVAIKVLRHAVGEDTARRFLAERQILATLDHPNIATLHDGGLTQDGRPYFVMEYVEGTPLDTYCDDRRLSVVERLRLLLPVVRAVHDAHQNLVVHRDLKPSNVLVTEDGTGKLLDFGIAKLLDPTAAGLTQPPQTRTGRHPMTLAYASPEQVTGETITTASDVYQLGLVLYELLAGRRPYYVKDRTPSEIERIVCEQDPTRPSTAVTEPPTEEAREAEASSAAISACRNTSPPKLQKKLQGDLDTCVLKALRKEPERRYDSAEQLADDLHRYLNDRPVTAREDTLGYRTRKFVQRHRWSLAAITVIALLVVGYAVTVTVQSQRVRNALEQVRLEKEKSEQVTGFLVNIFERANPFGAPGPAMMFSDTLTTRELLDQGAVRVRQELSGQPEVQATMMYNLGRINRQLGRYRQAAPLLEDALALRRKHLPSTHLELAESLSELGHLLRERGDFSRAARLYREALTIRKNQLGTEHLDTAENLLHLGVLAAREGAYDRADSLFHKSLRMRQKLLGPDPPEVATAFLVLGLLHAAKKDYTGAERLVRRSLSIRQKHFGREHPDVAESLDRLGQVLVMQGVFDEAEPLLREALSIRQKLFKGPHPDRAESLNNLGRLLRQKGDYSTADRLHREALDMYQKMFGPENMDAASTLYDRARLHQAKGDYPTADSLYRRAVAMQESLHGPEHPYTQRFLEGLTGLHAAWDKPSTADSLQLPSAADANRP